jgi:hypothetical protein
MVRLSYDLLWGKEITLMGIYRILIMYKKSKKRLALLLAQFAIILYTIVKGDTTATILAVLLVPIWAAAYISWMED